MQNDVDEAMFDFEFDYGMKSTSSMIMAITSVQEYNEVLSIRSTDVQPILTQD